MRSLGCGLCEVAGFRYTLNEAEPAFLDLAHSSGCDGLLRLEVILLFGILEAHLLMPMSAQHGSLVP